MKKKIMERAAAYSESTAYPYKVYFTESVPDARYVGYKYFFKYCNTNQVAESFRTLNDLSKFLQDEGF